MTRAVTPRQAQVLALLHEGQARGVMPSIRELASALGVSSTNAVVDLLKALARKGLVLHVLGQRSRGSWVPVDNPTPPTVAVQRSDVVDALGDLGPEVTTADVLAVLARLGCWRAEALCRSILVRL